MRKYPSVCGGETQVSGLADGPQSDECGHKQPEQSFNEKEDKAPETDALDPIACVHSVIGMKRLRHDGRMTRCRQEVVMAPKRVRTPDSS